MSVAKQAKSRIAENNSEKILDAALSVFARFGLRGARLDQIAQQAEMSKPNLLYYFRSKDELYKAVLKRTLNVWLDALQGFDAQADPATAIRGFIQAKLAYSRERPEASRLFAIEIIQGGAMLKDAIDGDLAGLVESKAGTIRGWIEQGKLAPVDPYHLIFNIWATTQHYADFGSQIEALTGQTLADKPFHETALATMQHIFLNGILPRE
jgi:TetR/AcrR family transcriptional regulator